MITDAKHASSITEKNRIRPRIRRSPALCGVYALPISSAVTFSRLFNFIPREYIHGERKPRCRRIAAPASLPRARLRPRSRRRVIAIIPDFGFAVANADGAEEEEEAATLSVVSVVLRSRTQFHFVAMDLIGSS